MTTRERFQAVLDGRTPDRLPVMEWAGWWDKTVRNWQTEEPNCPGEQKALFRHFGLDRHDQFWVSPRGEGCPSAPYHGAPVILDEAEYDKILPHLFTESIYQNLTKNLLEIRDLHTAGGTAVWFSLEGYFWFPRTLLGIENHLYAFYDLPELMQRMNRDLLAHHERVLETIYAILTPEFMTFAEDMSYNNGPMLSRALYDEFMLPCCQKIVPQIKARGTKVFIDTDGFLEPMIPWFRDAGIEGVLPLERQSGVDVNRIRCNHPDWLMLGGFDKTVMHLGEAAMRAEFERLLPAMRSGRFLPGVDHQTPPDVSLENYRIYVNLLREYAEKGVQL